MPLVVPLAERVANVKGAARPDLPGQHLDRAPASARGAARAALERGETHYTDRPGILPLRRGVAERLRRHHGIDIDPVKGVVITCGVTEARFVAIQQLLREGAGTVVAASHPERVAAACVVRGVRLATGGAEPDGSVLLYAATDTPAEARDASFARARLRGWGVLYEVAGTEPSHPAASGLADQTVTIGDLGAERGISAWRVGFLAAPAVTAGPLRDFKQALTICTTNLSQWGALALMEEQA